MSSPTVTTDRQLRADLEALARRELGRDATQDALESLTTRWYFGPRHRSAGTETPVERWRRERAQHNTGAALKKAKEPCFWSTRAS